MEEPIHRRNATGYYFKELKEWTYEDSLSPVDKDCELLPIMINRPHLVLFDEKKEARFTLSYDIDYGIAISSVQRERTKKSYFKDRNKSV